MEIQKQKFQTQKDYERAVFVLKTIQDGRYYGPLSSFRTKQLNMVHNCIERIGLTTEEIDNLSIIHVTGTKGKGSTCSYIESILRHYGYKTGVFNSPHVIEIRDRIIINGMPVDKSLFTSAFWHVFDRLQTSRAKHNGLMPGFFVFILLVALHLFLQQQVDVVILEVGIGGEYDATNFLQKPAVCGVTSLHVEHADVLGNTIEEIAWHKAGIVKTGVPMVTLTHQDSVMDIILDRALEKQCPVYVATPLTGRELGGAALGIAGDKQPSNAGLALHICRLWRQQKEKVPGDVSCDVNGVDCRADVISAKGITPKDTIALTREETEGLVTARLPGRSQVLKRNGVTYFLDGAHTTESMEQCVAWFNETAKKEANQLGCKVYRALVFRMKKDKRVGKHLPYLMKCGFCRAAFVPYVVSTTDRLQFPDSLDLGEDPEAARLISLSQLKDWNQLHVQTDNNVVMRSDPCSSESFPSIVSGLWWAGMAKDTPLQSMAMADLSRLNQCSDTEPQEGGMLCPNGPQAEDEAHVQVLVTGSLALVGGALNLLQPNFWV